MHNVMSEIVGGAGGNEFSDYIPPGNARIKVIHIFTNEYIDAIQFGYLDDKGEIALLPKVGGDGGFAYQFVLDEDEYLTGICGRYGWYIDQLCFHTNKRKSETFGGKGGITEFSIKAPANHEVIGLFGRKEWYLDAIGIISRKLTPEEIKRSSSPHDLQKVEGIGPKIAELLVEHGILDLEDLSTTSVEQLKLILHEAGSHFAMADPSTWPQQAALGAKGEWDKLAALQKELDKGRRV